MSSVSLSWYIIVGLVCLFAVADWRKAIFLGILVDALRDPVRKLSPGQSVKTGLIVAIVYKKTID